MSTSTVHYDVALSPAYRQAVRSMAQWLEPGPRPSHRHQFTLRQTLSALEGNEYQQFVRWLAWWCAAAQSHGDTSPLTRLRRLDATLAGNTQAMIPGLPGWQHASTLQRSA